MTKRVNTYIKQLIDIIVRMLNEKDPHWATDWDKAKYRIVKRYNDAGITTFMPERKLKADWEKLLNVSFSCLTEDEARYRIEQDKQFYREAWFREKTDHVEIIEVK